MEKKISPIQAAKIGFCLVASVGVDTVLTGIVATVLPKSYGIPGLVQKLCVKAGTLGLSMVAADAIEGSVEKYIKVVSDEIDKELNPNKA